MPAENVQNAEEQESVVRNPLVVAVERASAAHKEALKGAGLNEDGRHPAEASYEPEVSVTEEGPPSDESSATPTAQERAKELGVDLSKVKGSGSGGKVTTEDVEKAAKQDKE